MILVKSEIKGEFTLSNENEFLLARKFDKTLKIINENYTSKPDVNVTENVEIEIIKPLVIDLPINEPSPEIDFPQNKEVKKPKKTGKDKKKN